MSRRIMLVPLLLLVITLTACQVGNSNKEKEQNNEPQKIIKEDVQNPSTEDTYEVSESSYAVKEIRIKYPQITGLSNPDRQKRVNDLIEKEALSVLDFYETVEEEVNLDLDYYISWQGPRLLSIQYSGVGNIEGAVHPTNIFYTTNIDLNKASKVKLADYVVISEDFVNKLQAGKHIPWDEGLGAAIELIMDNINSYNLSDELTSADSIGFENILNSFSYFTDDSLGISIGVPHVVGDHAEFEIKYQDIKGNIKTEHEIWKDLLQKGN